MSCTIGIPIPDPVLPSPFTITPPGLPPIPVDVTLCCKLVAFTTPPFSVPLPPGVSALLGDIIDAMTSALLPYFDAIPLKCPKE